MFFNKLCQDLFGILFALLKEQGGRQVSREVRKMKKKLSGLILAVLMMFPFGMNASGEETKPETTPEPKTEVKPATSLEDVKKTLEEIKKFPAAYDYVASRSDVDPRRVAIMAYSMGGYYAPRAAAFEKRFAACVAWGGHFDYHATWVTRRKILESGGNKVSAPHFQLPWVMGMPDMDSAMKKTAGYNLAGVAEKVTCPFLVTHGEDDSISPVENARLLYNTVSSKQKTLKVFTAEEGGSEHCQGDNRFLGATYVADWLADHL